MKTYTLEERPNANIWLIIEHPDNIMIAWFLKTRVPKEDVDLFLSRL